MNKEELKRAKRLIADYDLHSPTLISALEIDETEAIQTIINFLKELVFKKNISNSTRLWMKEHIYNKRSN